MLRRMRYVAIAVLLVACGKSGGTAGGRDLSDDRSGPGLAAAKQLSESECRTEATAVGDLLVAAAQEPPSPLALPDDVQLVTRTDLPVQRDLRTAPGVVLTPSRIALDDHDAADLGALETELHARYAKLQHDLDTGVLQGRWAPDPRLVYFAIAPDTPWQRITDAVSAAARAGFEAPAFAFEQPQTLKPAPRSKIDDKLDAIQSMPPSDRAVEVAKLASKLVEECTPLQKAFGVVGAVEGEDKAMTIARAVGPALIECKCRVDLPALRSVLFRVLYVPRPVRVLAFDPDAAKESIALPPQTTWAEASKRFTPALHHAELIAR